MSSNDPTPTNTSPAGAVGALTWLGSWLAIILLLITLVQVEWGKRIVYAVAWLSIVLLIVTHSSELAGLFGSFAQGPGAAGPSVDIPVGGTITPLPSGPPGPGGGIIPF